MRPSKHCKLNPNLVVKALAGEFLGLPVKRKKNGDIIVKCDSMIFTRYDNGSILIHIMSGEQLVATLDYSGTPSVQSITIKDMDLRFRIDIRD